jgi:hypothetical protein
MLQYFTLLFIQRNTIMTFYTRKLLSLPNGIQNYARPFEEILHSYDLTSTNNGDLCPASTPTKDALP